MIYLFHWVKSFIQYPSILFKLKWSHLIDLLWALWSFHSLYLNFFGCCCCCCSGCFQYSVSKFRICRFACNVSWNYSTWPIFVEILWAPWITVLLFFKSRKFLSMISLANAYSSTLFIYFSEIMIILRFFLLNSSHSFLLIGLFLLSQFSILSCFLEISSLSWAFCSIIVF